MPRLKCWKHYGAGLAAPFGDELGCFRQRVVGVEGRIRELVETARQAHDLSIGLHAGYGGRGRADRLEFGQPRHPAF